ncbi:MAG: dodecin [Acetobacteraceae bacterium]|jgi:dodecin
MPDRHNDQATGTETSRLIGVLVANHGGDPQMPEHVYKVVEIVGSSEESVSKAIDCAIQKAAVTLRNIGWFEVEQVRGHIENGKVAHYQVTLKLGFRLDE